MHCTLHLASACINPIPSLRILKNAGADFSLLNKKNQTIREQALQRIETYSKEIQAEILTLFTTDDDTAKKESSTNGIAREAANLSASSSKNAIVEKWLTQSMEEVDDSESSRDSQTSIYDDLKSLRNENIKVRRRFTFGEHKTWNAELGTSSTWNG